MSQLFSISENNRHNYFHCENSCHNYFRQNSRGRYAHSWKSCPMGARAHEPCPWTGPVGQGLWPRAQERGPWTWPMSLGLGQGPERAGYQALRSSQWILHSKCGHNGAHPGKIIVAATSMSKNQSHMSFHVWKLLLHLCSFSDKHIAITFMLRN